MYPSGTMTATWIPACVLDSRTQKLNGLRSAPSPPAAACVVHIVLSAQTVSTLNAPRTSASARAAIGRARHLSTALPERSASGAQRPPLSEDRPSLRNRRAEKENSPPAGPIRPHPRKSAAPLSATASASSAASTASAYCAAVLRVHAELRLSSRRSRDELRELVVIVIEHVVVRVLRRSRSRPRRTPGVPRAPPPPKAPGSGSSRSMACIAHLARVRAA